MKTSNPYLRLLKRNIGYVIAIIGVCVLAAVLIYSVFHPIHTGPEPTTFYECSQQYPVTEGQPRICKVPFGKVFEEYVGNLRLQANEIHIYNLPPSPSIVTSPITVKGDALPDWFNGQGLTVELVAGTGEVIASVVTQPTQADAAEPISAYKSFSTTLTFTPQEQGTQGALIFKSGASSTAALVWPVVF